MKISSTPRSNTLPSGTLGGFIHAKLGLIVSLALVLASCGAGGGSSSPPPARASSLFPYGGRGVR